MNIFLEKVRGDIEGVAKTFKSLIDRDILPLFTSTEFPLLGYFLTSRLLQQADLSYSGVLLKSPYLLIHVGRYYNSYCALNILFDVREDNMSSKKKVVYIDSSEDAEVVAALVCLCDFIAAYLRRDDES